MCWFLVKHTEEENLKPIHHLHEMTLWMARSPGLAQLLNDMQIPAFREEMKKDAVSGLKSRSIEVPEGATVDLRQFGADGWEVEAKVVENEFTYIVGFNNKTGFFAKIQGPKMHPKAG